MTPRTLAIVGVGLIGGSVGLAARRRRAAARVLGVDRDADVLRRARQRGALDEACAEVPAAAAVADLVVFCTPVDAVAAQVLAAAPACRPGTVLTDAGSTKAAIVRAVEGRLPPAVPFVGGHPLAGSEKQGPEHADPDLFRDRLVVLTPAPSTDEGAVGRVAAFWQSLGARVERLSPEGHDRALALTSHLPHLVASALAGLLPPELAGLTATGFRDTTRVAAGDSALWAAIFEANRADLLAALGRLDGRLEEFRRALEGGDRAAIVELLNAGRHARAALDEGA
jgi:prephenate dehydrogenase